MLLGDGAGGLWGYNGYDQYNGPIWKMPSSGATVGYPYLNHPVASLPYHWDLVPLPASTLERFAPIYKLLRS